MFALFYIEKINSFKTISKQQTFAFLKSLKLSVNFNDPRLQVQVQRLHLRKIIHEIEVL